MFGRQKNQRRRIDSAKARAFGLISLTFMLTSPADAAQSIDDDIDRLQAAISKHSAQVFALEQELLHPADTRVAVFLTLGTSDSLDLDAVELYVNGKPVASHLYSERERGSLAEGGTQQLFTGNLANGAHELKAVITARAASDHFVRRETVHRFRKVPGTLRLQMSVEARAPEYEPRISFVEWK